MSVNQVVISGLFMYLCMIVQGIVSIQLSDTISHQPILGGSFSLECSFTLDSGEAAGSSILLGRNRQGDSGFSYIVTFPFSVFDRFNASYVDTTLESRTIATKPENSRSSRVSLHFSTVKCDDAAQYQWIIRYFKGVEKQEERISDVTVKVEGTFSGSTDFGLTHSPDTQDVVETTNVTFRCKAELGSEPTGQLAWYYYSDGSSSPVSVSDQARKEALTVYNICSYTQVSTLVLTMTQQLNGVVVRCTLQQDTLSPDGDNGNEHRQTNPFNVSYSPRQTTVVAFLRHTAYSEGESLVTLTCSAVANPRASYSWVLPDGSEIAGRTYQLRKLQINDTGNYTCLAKNGIPNENYEDTYTHKVIVVEKTTTTTTTSITSKSPTTGNDFSANCTCPECEADNKVAIVAGCMSVVIAFLTAALVYLLIRQQKCLPSKGNMTYEIPDRSRQRSEDVSYDTLQQPGDSYEVPVQRTAQTYANTELTINTSA